MFYLSFSVSFFLTPGIIHSFLLPAKPEMKAQKIPLGLLREVLSEWIRIRRSTTADKRIPQENVHALFSEMPLYFPQDQVGVMLGTKDRGERGEHLRYAHHYHNLPQTKRTRGNTRNQLPGKVHDRNGLDKKKRHQKMKRNVGSDVFLGGSCNPTTWRKDVAIPLLEDRGITYFNPQVAEWTEDLISVEHNAKESATVLFYVLDRRTRNVVGIVELANFVGSKRDVVLVTDPYKLGEPVAGENISEAEYEELCGGLSTLQDLVARQGILVHGNITDAIESTEKILNNIPSSRRKTSLKNSREYFHNFAKSSKEELNFSKVLAAYFNKSNTDLSGISTLANSSDGIKKNIDQIRPQNGSSDVYGFNNISSQLHYDIYVGGSCFDFEWKENVALPILRESRLKFLFAGCGSVKSSQATESEVLAMENSKVLLFIITNRTRGLETMALASYFIGCHKNVVLCIQNLAENTTIRNEQLSKIAVKDYNRGRSYLSDLAIRSGVPVFDRIDEAVQEAISRCKSSKTSTR